MVNSTGDFSRHNSSARSLDQNHDPASKRAALTNLRRMPFIQFLNITKDAWFSAFRKSFPTFFFLYLIYFFFHFTAPVVYGHSRARGHIITVPEAYTTATTTSATCTAAHRNTGSLTH